MKKALATVLLLASGIAMADQVQDSREIVQCYKDAEYGALQYTMATQYNGKMTWERVKTAKENGDTVLYIVREGIMTGKVRNKEQAYAAVLSECTARWREKHPEYR